MTKDEFKKTQDYLDICYMVDHVQKIETRVDVLRSLGYSISPTITKNNVLKEVFVGKQGELRMQISPKFNSSNVVWSAVIKNN